MELLDVHRSLVLVVDMQGKLMEMIHRPPLVTAATRRLLALADLFEVPVILTEQYPQGLGPTHPEIQATFDELRCAKRLVQKESFGCCGEPSFEDAVTGLRPDLSAAKRQFVVAGIEAHICVMQTVVELLRQGSQVHLLWEATSGRGAEYRDWALRRMESQGAVISNHESVGFEWARDKNHPQFKAMSSLFKEGQIV